MKIQCDPKGDEVTIRSLVPTMRFDMHIVKEMSDTLQDNASLQNPIFLLGGGKSPNFFKHSA